MFNFSAMQGYKEGPPGDDYFSRARGEDGGAHHLRFLQLLPGWAQAASQHAAPTKVKLPPFWTRDSRSWFTLAESTFNRSRHTRAASGHPSGQADLH